MIRPEVPLRIEKFGRITHGVTYEHDVVIDHGKVRKRKKKPSKEFRDGDGVGRLRARSRR
jgi:hypothetical protein